MTRDALAAAESHAAAGGSTAAALVTPAQLMAMLQDGEELALLDVREELIYSRAHLLYARSVPLSRLEVLVPRLVPRRGTRVVLMDDGGRLAEMAVAILHQHGYDNLSVLAGGLAAWSEAGYEVFSGVNVVSKAFGEVVEHAVGTPSLDPLTLKQMIDRGDDMIIVDSRPFDEFARVSIPAATSVPGAELVLRVGDLAPSSDTLVVVNCAGRTRSIIGAQSLINAGLPNRVMALRNGTMGWTLAGLSPEHGQTRRLAAEPPSGATLARARAAAETVARRCGIGFINADDLRRLQAEADTRTVHVFDVRDPREYAAGHVAGAISAPGGQLVQATDHYVGTLNARIVLVDDLAVRALMTASWLWQMGWDEVFVLAEAGSETGRPQLPVLGDVRPAEGRTDADAVARLMQRDAVTIIDLSLSRHYRDAHIPGAWFAIRRRLDHAFARLQPRHQIVLTSEDGTLAALALDEMRAVSGSRVGYLDGGNAGWTASGRSLTADDPRLADEAIDAWLKPYERPSDATAAMQEYLAWEVDLLDRIKRDGTVRFRPLPPER